MMCNRSQTTDINTATDFITDTVHPRRSLDQNSSILDVSDL
jgi:hypothetical protein